MASKETAKENATETIAPDVQEEPVAQEEPMEKYDPWNDLVECRIPLFRGGDTSDVFVGVNGHNYQIKRGVTVMIPRCVKEVLDASQEQDEHTAHLISQLIN